MYQEALVDTRHIAFNYSPDDVLSQKEMDVYDSLTNACAERKREWLGGRIALKKILRDLTKSSNNWKSCEVFNNENGVPHVDGPLHVSISHQDGQVVGVASKYLIGVDLVGRKSVSCGVQKYYMSDKERLDSKGFNKKESSSLIWSIKEAYLKAVGTGLTQSPKTIEVFFKKVNSELSPQALIFKNNKHQKDVLVFYRKYKSFFLSTVIVRS